MLLSCSSHITDLIIQLDKVEPIGNAMERATVVSALKKLLNRATTEFGNNPGYLDINVAQRRYDSKHGFSGIGDNDEICQTVDAISGACWVLVLRNSTYVPVSATAFICSTALGNTVFGTSDIRLKLTNGYDEPTSAEPNVPTKPTQTATTEKVTETVKPQTVPTTTTKPQDTNTATQSNPVKVSGVIDAKTESSMIVNSQATSTSAQNNTVDSTVATTTETQQDVVINNSNKQKK